MLVDDDRATNYLHLRIINNVGCAEKVVSVHNGEAALEYMLGEYNEHRPRPDLIFLDINMPAMNGWEFLDEYRKLKIEKQGKVIVVMLTSSLNASDREKAEEMSTISQFINKPLSEAYLQELLEIHFPEFL